jgi:hypothetical protein
MQLVAAAAAAAASVSNWRASGTQFSSPMALLQLILLLLLSLSAIATTTIMLQAVAALENMELEMQSRPSLKLWRESQYRCDTTRTAFPTLTATTMCCDRM